MNHRKKVTIGILTGGGDVPGLNACIKNLVNLGIDSGIRVLGIRMGWKGLLSYNHDDPGTFEKSVIELTKPMVRTANRSGGTILHTSRTNPAAVKYSDAPDFLKDQFSSGENEKIDFTLRILSNMDKLGINVIVPIGGDDTLSYAERLHREGFPVVAIPKTMDNDVFGTDYCIGFSTAITRSVNFIHALRTATGSHERIAVIELFGRYCGETSLISAYLAGVDRAIISEVPFNIDRLAAFLKEDRKRNPSNYAMMTISEGATMENDDMVLSGEKDSYGHRKLGGIGVLTGEAIRKITGIDIIFQPLLYLMRSGTPDSLDLMVALNYACMAIDLICNKTIGRMVALKVGKYIDIPISTITGGSKRVDVNEFYDIEQYRPKIKNVVGKPIFLY
ncbi:MAG: 6-phosphofructokinase [Deltaproteobacteria bacterium]|nr:6-phosphofructokinase [Deltaproteobacteria bacterium]MBW1993359.1 6-phosphofructokinase [Deltaproteobacteria bacterium]MBW2151277.1 6-phosphofructokinase [Deltaproteobacteria bacterium]